MNLMPILLCYISQVMDQKKFDTFSQKCGEKQSSVFKVAFHLSSPKPFQY